MSKFVSDDAHDAKLNEIATSNAVHVCSGDPADRATAIANSLATFSPTYTSPADGGAGIRRFITLQQATGVNVTTTGTAATLCHIDATVLQAKTDITGTPGLTSGQVITVNASNINSLDAT